MSATKIGPLGPLPEAKGPDFIPNIVARQANDVILHPQVPPVFYGQKLSLAVLTFAEKVLKQIWQQKF